MYSTGDNYFQVVEFFKVEKNFKVMISHSVVLYILVYLCTFLYANKAINLLISINWNGRTSCVSISLLYHLTSVFC